MQSFKEDNENTTVDQRLYFSDDLSGPMIDKSYQKRNSIAISMDDLIPNPRKVNKKNVDPVQQQITNDPKSALVNKVDAIFYEQLCKPAYYEFRFLLDSLTVLLHYERLHGEYETAKKIFNEWDIFNTALIIFLQHHILIPNDVVSVLQFMIAIDRYYTNVLDTIPKKDLMQAYDCMKYADVSYEMENLLRQLQLFKRY